MSDDASIAAYLARLETNPKDLDALKRLAELKQRAGDDVTAAHYFAEVAEVMVEEGALLKAVAMMKHAAKLDGARVETQVRLAELHGLLQLHEEAASHLQLAAAHYEEAGAPQKALELTRRFVKDAPTNVVARIMLAELAVRFGQPQEAIKALREGAIEFERRGRVDDQIVVLTKLAAIQPGAGGVQRLLAMLHLKRGDAAQAIAWLTQYHRSNTPDPDTLRMAAVAFESMGEAAKAAACWKEVARQHETAGRAPELAEARAQVARLAPGDPPRKQ